MCLTEKFKYIPVNTLINLGCYLLYCLIDIQEKWIMQFLSIKPFTLLFFEGLSLFFFLFLIILIIVLASFSVFNFSLLWGNIGWFLLNLFTNFCLSITKIQTIFIIHLHIDMLQILLCCSICLFIKCQLVVMLIQFMKFY